MLVGYINIYGGALSSCGTETESKLTTKDIYRKSKVFVTRIHERNAYFCKSSCGVS